MTECRNLTVMFTDINGFTERAAKASQEDLAALLRKREAIVLPVLQARDGTLIKTIGDAFLLTFESPTNAVLAAIDAQAALALSNATAPKQERIEIRIAVGAGEVTVIDDDVFGDAVNITARLEAIAEPNEVYFTESVLLTMNRVELQMAVGVHRLRVVEVGHRTFEGVEQPVRVFRIHPQAVTGQVPELAQPLVAKHRTTRRMTLKPNEQAMMQRSRLRSAWDEFAAWVAVGSTPVRAMALPAGGIALAMALLVKSYWLMAVALLAALVGFPHRLISAKLRVVAAAVAAGLVLGAPDVPLHEAQGTADALLAHVVSDGPDSLSVVQRSTVYLLHSLAAAEQHLVGHPDSARALSSVMVPGPEKRTFRSDHLMDSEGVRRRIALFAKRLGSIGKSIAEVSMKDVPMDIRLDPERTQHTHHADLSAKARRTPRGWSIRATARIPMGYPRDHDLPVLTLSGSTLTIRETLFWALERAEWLFPYEAEWIWSVASDDPRIANTPAKSADK